MIFRHLILSLSLAAMGASTVAQDLLPPEKAYRVQSRQVGQEVIEFDYQIAPGYILYKDRFRAELIGAPGQLEVELPPAQSKLDRTTKQKIDFYRDRVTVRVKLPPGQTKATRVTATAQGCAVDAGVCYPPVVMTWTPPAFLDVESILSRKSHPCPDTAHASKPGTQSRASSASASC